MKKLTRILAAVFALVCMISAMAVTASAAVNSQVYVGVSNNGQGFIYDSNSDPKLKTGEVDVKVPAPELNMMPVKPGTPIEPAPFVSNGCTCCKDCTCKDCACGKPGGSCQDCACCKNGCKDCACCKDCTCKNCNCCKDGCKDCDCCKGGSCGKQDNRFPGEYKDWDYIMSHQPGAQPQDPAITPTLLK